MPLHCELLEVRNSEMRLALPAQERRARNVLIAVSGCAKIMQPCGTCFSIFCPPCRFLHRMQHSKPVHGERRERKRLKTSPAWAPMDMIVFLVHLSTDISGFCSLS